MSNDPSYNMTTDDLARWEAARRAEELAYRKQYERDFGKYPVGRELADHEGW